MIPAFFQTVRAKVLKSSSNAESTAVLGTVSTSRAYAFAFVEEFVDAGPASDDEFDACYRLALLFESHAFPENAAACYRKILAVRPGYRDAPDRLRAAETDYRGAAAKDYERVLKEDSTWLLSRPTTLAASPISRTSTLWAASPIRCSLVWFPSTPKR
jgi:hypothetical protein